MTSEADPYASTVTTPNRFGSDMARRVRPRTGRLRQRDGHHFVGAVGRSSAGFGRAIGRSGAIRPVVDSTNLDTYALRPPRGWWHASSTEAETSFDDTFEVQPDAGRSGASSRNATPKVAPPAARRPDVRRTTTWTDRLLPDTKSTRSTSARPRRPAPSPGQNAAPTPPVAFVPSGDARLDRLRLIYAAGLTPKQLSGDAEAIARVTRQLAPHGAGGVESATHDSPAQRPRRSPDSRPVAADSSPTDAGSIDRSAPASHAGSRSADHGDSAARDGRRGDTTAGPATGPGGLGRRVRPEPVAPQQMSDRNGATIALPRSFPTATPGAPAGDAREGSDGGRRASARHAQPRSCAGRGRD